MIKRLVLIVFIALGSFSVPYFAQGNSQIVNKQPNGEDIGLTDDSIQRAVLEGDETFSLDFRSIVGGSQEREMALIPAGCFSMETIYYLPDEGIDNGQSLAPRASAQQEVCFESHFWMDVTVYDTPMNWNDAAITCLERGLTLPSQEQWQYAALVRNRVAQFSGEMQEWTSTVTYPPYKSNNQWHVVKDLDNPSEAFDTLGNAALHFRCVRDDYFRYRFPSATPSGG